jgi:alkaline phosphatase D
MERMDRRHFIRTAASFTATAVWGRAVGEPSQTRWREVGDFYPEGVASGDPTEDSVLLWTRRPPVKGATADHLVVEISEDEGFKKVVASSRAPITPQGDWTCRVLVGGLKPDSIYWYRFADSEGRGSRLGRTRTAPAVQDPKPVRFAFVSCQNCNQGAQTAYRRMIFEDERLPIDEQLGFVLHLGDFIYEIVWYPEDRPQGMYDRRLRDIVRYANGEKIEDFHIPTTVDDYRAIYRAYLHDPDIQDARARWPFVSMWDNHEFSWLGWQGMQEFEGETRPAQTRKVSANQAFFEYQPARMVRPFSKSMSAFDGPAVKDVAITKFDEHGLGQEQNNLEAIASLKGYRALRWGKNVELMITDQRSYRSEEPTGKHEAAAFLSKDFPDLFPEEAMRILDGGRTYNSGQPPDTIAFGGSRIVNFRKSEPPQTVLGLEQKKWFLDQLHGSQAAWKIWGNTTATLDMRADPQNLPEGLTQPWPGEGYAGFGGGDWSSAYSERGEIYDFVEQHSISGFVTIAGDRHSFWAGLAAKALPPDKYSPVGIAFVTGSISAPGMVEALEHGFPKQHPLRPLYLGQGPLDTEAQPTVNMLLRHGVRSCLEYAESGNIDAARKLSNHNLSPHLSFVDMEGHGYSVVTAKTDSIKVDFVCIPRPLERSSRPDGGPLRYRVSHAAPLWEGTSVPKLKQEIMEGAPGFSI